MVHIYPPRQRLEGLEADILKVVSYGATPEQWEAWIQVPLEHAAACGNLDLVTKLLEARGGRSMSGWKGCRGRTVLDAAALGGNAKVVSVLLAPNRARWDLNVVSVSSGRSALYLAVVCGHEAAARELIFAGHDVNRRDPIDQCCPLYKAVSDGHEQLVRDLLEARACPNARHCGQEGYAPLHVACSRGHTGIISALLAGGADKDVEDNRGAIPLHHTISQDHVDTTEILLAAGANITIGGSFVPFILAACKRNVEILKLFIKRGVDVNFRDELGSTALHAAALGDLSSSTSTSSSGGAASATRAIHTLVDGGADVDAQRLDGGAPLHYAAAFTSFSSRFDVMLALLQRGASIDLIHSITAQTPLHLACQHQKRGVDAIVDLLLRWGADETAVGGDGRTPTELLEEIDLYGRKDAAYTVPEDNGRREQLAREEEIERARVLLARAGEDRAWRRRCLAVMIRWRQGKARATLTPCTSIDDIITGSGCGSTSCATTLGGERGIPGTIETRPTGMNTAALHPGCTSEARAAPEIETTIFATDNNVDNTATREPQGYKSGGGRSNHGRRDEGAGQNELLQGMMDMPEGVFRMIVGFF